MGFEMDAASGALLELDEVGGGFDIEVVDGFVGLAVFLVSPVTFGKEKGAPSPLVLDLLILVLPGLCFSLPLSTPTVSDTFPGPLLLLSLTLALDAGVLGVFGGPFLKTTTPSSSSIPLSSSAS